MTSILRTQKQQILEDLKSKMVILVGPRQVGKTYLSKEIAEKYKYPKYLNYDNVLEKRTIKNMSWEPNTDLVIFDEIHKMPKWKNYLKGVYDTKNKNLHILVTGSARLEAYRKAGDSMAGRYFAHHLLPLSLKELKNTEFSGNAELLLARSGFPEPFLAKNQESVERWRESVVDKLVKEDVLDFADIDKFQALKNVFEILRTKVGSDISYANIAQDLDISPKTVKKYIEILESLYIIFQVRTYTKKINRSILKAPKIYFYDVGLVKGDKSIVLENLVAYSLLKEILIKRDNTGEDNKLMYLKNRENKEVDFAIVDKDDNLKTLIEVKIGETKTSNTLRFFSEMHNVPAVQLVYNLNSGFMAGKNVRVTPLINYLENLEI